MGKKNLEMRVLDIDPEGGSETSAANRVMRVWNFIGRKAAPYFIQESQLNGTERVVDNEGKVNAGPYLWLLKHESLLDALAAPPLWDQMGKPPMKVIAKKDMTDVKGMPKPLVRFISWATSPLIHEVHRPFMGDGASEEEVQKLREENRKKLDQLRSSLEKGYHIGMAPEGTTLSDGRISPIRSGPYNLSRLANEDGSLDIIRCVPIGNTLDLLSGDTVGKRKRKRKLFFFNVGEPLVYEPVDTKRGETEDEWVKRDLNHFKQRIKNSYIELNTITASQVVGEYLIRRSRDDSDKDTSLDQLSAVLESKVEDLRQVDGVTLDGKLLSSEGQEERMGHLYDSLLDLGYLEGSEESASIQDETILLVPDKLKTFKKKNPLLYTANRLIEVMEYDPRIDKILKDD